MIKKFTSGNPIDTQAVVEKFNALPIAEFPLGGKFENGNFVFEFDMQTATSSTVSAKLREESTSVVGCITAFAVMTRSTPKQSHPSMPLTISLCSAVQKLLVFLSTSRQKSVGTSATQPQTKTVITIDGTNFDIYYIDGTKPLEIVKEFRKSIGTSYVPPFWGHRLQQSRWSYHNAEGC